MGYKIALDIYSGPLDLLLHLIRREEVDIYDIPIAKITEQYLAYLDVLKVLDIDLAGDFIVMAATLMEIKARMLLPRPEVEEEDEEDPRFELVKQLMEYKRFKDVGRTLGQYAQERAMRFARLGEDWPEEKKEDDESLKEVGLWDLVDAFSTILKQTTLGVSTEIVYDDTPIEVYRAEILERLRDKPVLSFSDLFRGGLDRSRVLGIFLALLELIRLRRIKAEQPSSFGEIQIVLREDYGTEPDSEVITGEIEADYSADVRSAEDEGVELEFEPAAEIAVPVDEGNEALSADASELVETDIKAEIEAEFSDFIGGVDESENGELAEQPEGDVEGAILSRSEDSAFAGEMQSESEPVVDGQSDVKQPSISEGEANAEVESERAEDADRKSAQEKPFPCEPGATEGLFLNLWRRGKTLIAGLIKRDRKDS